MSKPKSVRNLWRRRLLLDRRFLVAVIIVTGLLGGTAVYAQAARPTTTYRTALVAYGTITQSIGMSGNLTPATQANLNFASSGTVASVDVQVGQSVTAGSTLAALDTSLLSAQLLQAQANLASAQAKLSADEAGPSASSLTSAQNSVNSAQVAVSNDQTALTDIQAINAQTVAQAQGPVTAAQNTVNADQTLLNQDQTTLTADQSAMTAACTADPTSAACTTDTAAVNTDKSKLVADQQTLAKDQATLESAQSALSSAQAKAQQSNDQTAAQLATAQQQLASAKSSLAALANSTSPAAIQGDEAQVQIDQVNVNTAQHQLAGATLTSPIAGIVEQVNIQAGQAVSAGGSGGSSSSSSSTSSNAIVVFTPSSYDVTGTVSDSQVNLVAVGQSAEVTPAGSTQAVLGKITAIAPAATVSSGVATFGVTAQLTTTDNSIKPGMSATVNIVVNQVVHVLTVPTSAVHTTTAGSTAQILVNGVPKTVSVQTGASDPTRIQIISGLQLNQEVVIAVITSSVPSSGAGTALGAGGTRGGGGGGFRGGSGG